MDNLIDITQASQFTGLKTSTLYKYVCCRKIPFIKLGERLLFDKERLEKWILEHSFEPVKSKAMG